jgi:hypothetical protein
MLLHTTEDEDTIELTAISVAIGELTLMVEPHADGVRETFLKVRRGRGAHLNSCSVTSCQFVVV